MNVEYFDEVIGKSTEFLKGTVLKAFQLNNADEQLIKTVSGNLIAYNKKTNKIKEKLILKGTIVVALGQGKAEIKSKERGVLFDSDKSIIVQFKDDDRVEELILDLMGHEEELD